MKRSLIVLILICFLSPAASAEVITLQNGDLLTGKLIRQDASEVVIQHEILGRLKLQRTQIAAISAEKVPSPAKKERQKGDLFWDRKLTAAYGLSSGNTNTQSLHGDFLIDRNRLWVHEWTVKGSADKQYADNESIAQRADGMIRWAYSIRKKYYNFYRFGAEHDYYENVLARLTPSTGLGDWILDTDISKALLEGGLGYEWTFPRGGEEIEAKPILHSRVMISQKITESLEIGTDIYYFPVLNDFGDYRIDGEAFARFLISNHLSWKTLLKGKRRARPARDSKKNDLQLLSGLEVSF